MASGTATVPPSRRGSWHPDQTAQYLLETIGHACPGALVREAVWVCEWPEKYPNKPRFHKDIERLLKVGLSISKLRKKGWKRRYAPKRWKGSLPKEVHQPRLHRALEPGEVGPPEAEHDAWDAVGIGLFHLGRVDRGGRRR